MKELIINYSNVNFKRPIQKTKRYDQEVEKIKKTILNLPALKLIKNDRMLNETIDIAKKFSKNKKNIIVFGTGGSNLGSRALINIMQGKQKKNILFYDNIDPIYFSNSIKKIDLNNSGFIVISKSGKTPETLSQLGCLVELYKNKYNLNKLFKNSLFITENTDNPLRSIGMQNECIVLDHELDIGGRYSIFSNVGMIPSIIAGVDVKKFHKGADKILSKINNNYFDVSWIINYFL